MLRKVNRRLDGLLPLIIPASVVIGLLFSARLQAYTGWVPWIFAFITFAGSIGLGVKDFRKVVSHPWPLIAVICILHALMPMLALWLGRALFPGQPLLVAGLVLLLLIPTGIVSFIWVSVYQGFVALTLSIILLDTLLSPFIVPWVLTWMLAADVRIDAWAMMKGLLWMVVTPSVAGMLLNHFTAGRVQTLWGPRLSPASKLGLSLVVIINSSVIAPYFKHFSPTIARFSLLTLALIAAGYIAGWAAARLMKADAGTRITLTFNSGMRNISAGAVLAIAYFPAAAAYPAVVGMLFQQMTAAVMGLVFFKKPRPAAAAERSA